MKFFLNVVCSLLAVGGVVAAASPQQEVQHRLRGGGVTTTTTTTKNAEERRLGPGETGPSGGVGVGFLTLADAKAECLELGTLVCGSVVCYNMITSLENCESRGTADLIDDSDWQSPGSADSGDASDVATATDMNATATEDSNVTNSGASDSADASASASADTTTAAAAAASSGDCTSITDTICAMEGVTVFCELLKNPKRRNLGLMDTNSTSTDEDEDTDTDADADAVMSSPTGASASGSSDGDGTEDFVSAFGFEDESEDFTLFVPTDAAFALIADKFEMLSDAEAGRVIMFHMYSGMLLTSDKLVCSEIIISMNEMSDASRTKCKNDGKKYQNGNGNTKTGSMPEIDTADHMACNGVIHTLDHVMFPVSLSQLHADA